MKYVKLSAQQIEKLKQKLLEISKKTLDKDLGHGDKESPVWKTYSHTSVIGKQVYQSFSDEELLEVLRQTAEALGHSPSQKEIFWVWREYIRLRFGKWPYALKLADLDRAAGKCGKTLEQIEAEREQIQLALTEVRLKAAELGRIPHPKDLPHVFQLMRRHMDSWGEVIEAAEIDMSKISQENTEIIEDLEEQYREWLEAIRQNSEAMGRAPIHGEVDIEIKRALIVRCGSWRNALYQIGLEPVKRIAPFSNVKLNRVSQERKRLHRNSLYDCHYKVLNLDAQAQKDLETLKRLAKVFRRVPDKKDVPDELRQRLQQSCGSWSNALYQIGLEG